MTRKKRPRFRFRTYAHQKTRGNAYAVELRMTSDDFRLLAVGDDAAIMALIQAAYDHDLAERQSA